MLENNMADFDIDILVENAPALIILYGGQIVMALVIFFIGKWVAKKIADAVINGMNKKQIDSTISIFVGSILKTLLITVVVIAALSQLGIQTASFVAIIGAAGLAIGFALQGTLSNFAAGVMLILLRPIRSGDFVEAAGAAAVVKEIGIFNTIMKTVDNNTIIVPNSAIMSNNITNYSLEATRRIDLVIGIAYDADIRKAKQVLAEITENEERVLKEPAVTIGLAELADSSVNFVVRPWMNAADFWPTKFALLETIKLRFDEENIGIPFPQLTVHLPKD